MMKFILTLLISLALLLSFSSAIEFDYCIADTSVPHGPLGYACKDPATAKADDFAYSGLRNAANSSALFNFGTTFTSVEEFPALNGIGISMVRADIGVGGAIPIHTHRVAELVIVTEGTLLVGFVDTKNTAFYKTLEKGDLFVVPPSLLHFQVNVGKVPATAYASFASSNPGVQAVSTALFRNDLPTDVLQKVTLLDPAQIQKLKKVFGGTN